MSMASSGKKKTTFAKLARESRLRERRLDKQARKEARKRAAELGLDPLAEESAFEDAPGGEDGDSGEDSRAGEDTRAVDEPAITSSSPPEHRS
jgi:hypothetical protein